MYLIYESIIRLRIARTNIAKKGPPDVDSDTDSITEVEAKSVKEVIRPLEPKLVESSQVTINRTGLQPE